MVISGGKSIFLYKFLSNEKGKPAESRGRKATGLKQSVLLWQPGCRRAIHIFA